MSDPVEFLSRTGYRRVTATTNAPITLTGDVLGTGTAGIVTTIKTSVNLAGNPTTTTQAPLDNSTKIATTAYADAAAAAAPGTYTNEDAQDAVGNILVDTATIDFTYDDLTPQITADLKNTTVTPASYGTASAVGTFTVDAQGRLTIAATVPISITASQTSDFNEAAEDAVGGILTDTATIDFTYNDAGNQITADLKNTTVVAASYGSASAVGTFTVDAQGRLTTAATVPISITASQISDFTSASTALIESDFTTSFLLMGA